MDHHRVQIRTLLGSLVHPTSNEQYVADQKALTDLFKQPEFFLILQEFAGDRSLSQPERLMASVVSGRELKTKWRSKVLVPEARKPEVRQRLFDFLEEPDAGIARPQLGLLVTVARIELPRHFPNLPQLLLNPLLACLSHIDPSAPVPAAPTTSTVLVNTLWTINALVKEWKTVKLAAGAEVMKTLENVFLEPLQRILEISAQREREGSDDLVICEAGRYAFKTLARFSSWHWGKAKGLRSDDAMHRINMLLHYSVHHAPLIQTNRFRLISSHQSLPPAKLLRILTKHLRAIGKWWRTMLTIDPKGFCKLEGATAGIGWWWGEVGNTMASKDGALIESDADDVSHPKSILLLGMLLFKDVLPVLSTDHPNIFTPEFVLSALHLLVDRLLRLSSTDLEATEDEPEEWFVREMSDEEAWAFEFRPCAERVLIALNNACRHFPPNLKVIEPEMLKMLHAVETAPPNDLDAIVRKEAIYCAVGRLSRALATHGGISFGDLLQGCSAWLGQPMPQIQILKRRLAWLIGQWVTSEEECVRLPLVWQFLVHLLAERGEASDRAVNLTAAQSIRECVDLWEMDISYFLPYLETTTGELLKLLGEATTLEGKRYVNETISVVIERTEDHIMPYLPSLAKAVPELWHGASGLEGEWLFKASLVVLTTKLVSAAKQSSGQLLELVVPLIEESLIPPAREFFEEDGLTLWQMGLYNSTHLYEASGETGLSRLIPGLLNELAHNLDLLNRLLGLLDSYLLLDATSFSSHYGSQLCATISQILSTSKANSDAIKRILSTISLLVRTTPIAQLGPLLLDADIFQHILAALEDDKASGMILAAYLEIIARIILADPNAFLHMVSESARRSNRPGEKVLEETLDAFWRNFDYVGDPRMRRAVAMAAGQLLTTGNHHTFDRLDGEFMNIFLDVLGESAESRDEQSRAETSIKPWKDEHTTQWAEIDGTLEGARRVALEDHDPAYAIPFKSFVIDTLHRAQAVGLGPYWAKADAGTKHSLEKFLL